ncbi:response regulator [Okeania sp. SIO1F9]|uniref:response regulator n=1 Tax=Okeania sp. SIO1F9 TaxID=2607813 RepID=UPI00144BC815|nr:response regulator [Okeania sp. SIO1F9]NET77860.1 response regulator [Okeania sp. SIO1F9]
MKILVVEDDQFIAETLADALTEQLFAVDITTDGQAGWEQAQACDYDLILLDVMLPKLDGITLCQKLRYFNKNIPILLLTARNNNQDKVKGLNAGADDYVVKPFNLEELLARIRALLRRGNESASPIKKWGNLCLNSQNCEVTYNNKQLNLTPKEYEILNLFMHNNQRVFSCSAILDKVWSFEDTPTEDTVRAHIKGLRHKLKAVGAPSDLIETVYGLGYRLKQVEEGRRRKEEEGRKKEEGRRGTTPCRRQTQAVRPRDDDSRKRSKPSEVSSPWERRPREGTLTKRGNADQESKKWMGTQTPTNCKHCLCGKVLNSKEKDKEKSQKYQESQQKLQDSISKIWDRFQGSINERIGVLEQVVVAGKNEILEIDLQKKAQQEAHKLAGSLGTFGLVDSSDLAREIETLLAAEKTLNSDEIFNLSKLVKSLCNKIEQHSNIDKEKSDNQQIKYLDRQYSIPIVPECKLLLILDKDSLFAKQLVEDAVTKKIQFKLASDVLITTDIDAYINQDLNYSLPDLSFSPNVVLLDLEVAANSEKILAKISSQIPSLPVVVLNTKGELNDRVKIAKLGASAYLKKPLPAAQVIDIVLDIWRKNQTLATVMIVDDDLQILETIEQILTQWGIKVVTLSDERYFWKILENKVPDLLILDIEMPYFNGIDLCQVIRNDPHWNWLPVIFLTAHYNPIICHQVFTAGADDYICKPFKYSDLITRVINRIKRSISV